MPRTTRHSLIAVLAFAVAPATLVAQEAQPAQPQLSPEIQGWVAEIQQLQSELAPVQQQAMQQDPELQAEQEQVGAAVQEAMLEIDPSLPEQSQRIEELYREAQAAQEAEDATRIMELSAEAQQIQQRLSEVQAQAMQHPTVTPQVEAFLTRLQSRMIEIDPASEARMQRLEELQQRVETAFRGQNQ